MRCTRTLAALLVLLGLLAGVVSGQRSVVPIDQRRFLQIELLEATPLGVYNSVPSSIGNGWYTGLRAAKFTYHSGRGFRAGISALDGDGVVMQYGLWAVAPIHVGYDIVLSPKRTGFFYGMVPSCYVEATLGAFPPYAKLAAACDVDWYGVGTGIEFGVIDWNPLNYPPGLYAALKLRLLDAAFQLPGRR